MAFFTRHLLLHVSIAAFCFASWTHASEPANLDWRGRMANSCPIPSLKTGSRLVFIGDSITDMKWGRNERDRNHYLGHSFVFLLAARLGVETQKRSWSFSTVETVATRFLISAYVGSVM